MNNNLKMSVMKRTINFLLIPVFLSLLLLSCEKKDMNNGQDFKMNAVTTAFIDLNALEECELPVDLMAGQHINVGKVDVVSDGTCIKVRFELSGSNYLTEVHVDVQSDPNCFPMTNAGNPKIGNFAYKASFDPSENKTVYETECIPVSGPVYIAAHAVVCGVMGYKEMDIEKVCENLPDEAKLKLKQGGIGYTTATISGGTSIDGTYPGWCIDPKSSIGGILYDVDLMCSYGDVSVIQDKVLFPCNFDLINYVINQRYFGKEMVEGMGVITNGDIQKAIWILIDGNYDQTAGISDGYDMDRVKWIVEQAWENGRDFIPQCDGVVAVILNATGPEDAVPAQMIIIEVPVKCEPVFGCETAWAKGNPFPGNSWAMFFSYDPELNYQ